MRGMRPAGAALRHPPAYQVSRGPENTFISSVHKHLPAKFYRMKNHNQYNGGIADVWYSGREADLWIEYKFIVVPKRGTTVINLVSKKDPEISTLQQEWLRSRHDEGRNVGVIVGCKDGGVWFPGTTWDAETLTSEFISRIASRKVTASLITDLCE